MDSSAGTANRADGHGCDAATRAVANCRPVHCTADQHRPMPGSPSPRRTLAAIRAGEGQDRRALHLKESSGKSNGVQKWAPLLHLRARDRPWPYCAGENRTALGPTASQPAIPGASDEIQRQVIRQVPQCCSRLGDLNHQRTPPRTQVACLHNTHIRRPAEREVSRYTAAIAHCAASMSACASALESRPDARIALTSLINA